MLDPNRLGLHSNPNVLQTGTVLGDSGVTRTLREERREGVGGTVPRGVGWTEFFRGEVGRSGREVVGGLVDGSFWVGGRGGEHPTRIEYVSRTRPTFLSGGHSPRPNTGRSG